jgi:hypothetical protein
MITVLVIATCLAAGTMVHTVSIDGRTGRARVQRANESVAAMGYSPSGSFVHGQPAGAID